MIQPNDTRSVQSTGLVCDFPADRSPRELRSYLLCNDIGNAPGTPLAWNRRILLLSAFFRLAAAHEVWTAPRSPFLSTNFVRKTVPAYNVTRVAQYDAIIKANINDFLHSLVGTFAATGQPTYLWYYRTPSTPSLTEEASRL